MPNDYTQTLSVANLIFAGIFTLEALLKLSVFGVWGYFQQAGNIFDFVIVVATAFGIFMDLIGADLGSAATVIRTIRILRVVRLFNGFKELKIIVDAIGFAIPYVLNILVLLFLIVSIFSVLFMQVRRALHLVPSDSSGYLRSPTAHPLLFPSLSRARFSARSDLTTTESTSTPTFRTSRPRQSRWCASRWERGGLIS
jgi:hypothetical protein